MANSYKNTALIEALNKKRQALNFEQSIRTISDIVQVYGKKPISIEKEKSK